MNTYPQNPIEVTQLISKHVQALHSDAIFYFSGELTLTTEYRKSSLLESINLIKTQISNLENLIESITTKETKIN